jgi:hypothetical protein
MIGSRVNFFPSALVLLTLAIFGAASSRAEEGAPASAPPRGLAPPTDTVESANDPTASPGDASGSPANDAAAWQPPAEETVPDKPGLPSGPRVTVAGLGTINPDGAGLMTAGSGGFPSELWFHSPRTAVAARIAQLPPAPGSPAMQTLLRRLLLTAAPPPGGVAEPDEVSFLAMRLKKILANGWLDEAAMLAGQSKRDDSVARQVSAEALLLQGREGDACSDATSLRQSENDPYWLKLRTYCYVVENNMPAATLTLDVMRERGIEDEVFFTLAGALTGAGAATTIDALPKPSGLGLALLRRAEITPPAALAAWVPATSLLSQQSANAEIRLAAAERAAVAGLLPPDQLRSIYETETFTPDEIDDPAEAAKSLTVSRANALFHQAIAKRTLPAAKAAAFAAALQRADAQNKFALFAQVSADDAKRLRPLPETAWLAPYIARVLLFTGQDRAAEQWLMQLTSPTDGPTVNAMQIHLALVRPTTENVARLQGALTWLGQNALKPGGAKAWLMERATREIPLLDALGYIVPPDAQWAVSANTAGVVPSGASVEALFALDRSSQEGRLGETVMNVLVALGPAGPTRAQGQTVVRAVKALGTVGLRDEARTIAIESVLGSPVRLRK